jgi:multicomponent Na+:H+ antiporter subunit D
VSPEAAATLVIAGPVLLGCVLLAVGRIVPRAVVDAAAVLGALAVAAAGGLLLVATRDHPVVVPLGGWSPAGGGIPLVADGLAAALVVLVGLLGAAALLSSWRYFVTVEARFHVLVMLFLAGMGGFVLSGDVFDMLVFFELMGAVAYALAAYKTEEARSVQGGLTFGITNSLGAYLSLCGIALLYARTGALGLAPLGTALPRPGGPDALVVLAFALLLTGWLVKAAVVPFHFWLADAHAVAPTPVCTLFSGIMAPLGIYAVLRVYPVVFADVLPAATVGRALIVLAVLTALVGALMCALQRHLKRLLAYSTIAHVGLFLLGVALWTAEGATASLVYLVGHSAVKAALFLLVGVLLARTGSVDEPELHGRGDRVTGVLFVVGGLALAGLPPFGTGLGKGLLEHAVAAGPVGLLLVGVVLVTSVATGAAVLRAALRVHFGVGPSPANGDHPEQTGGEDEERETAPVNEAPRPMVVAAGALLLGGLVVGAVPAVAHRLAVAAAEALDGARYRAAVLGAPVGPAPHAPEASWHLLEVGAGLGTAVAAFALAAFAAHRGASDPARWPGRARRRVERALEHLHSGHIGDYVTWLVVGTVTLTALVALP